MNCEERLKIAETQLAEAQADNKLLTESNDALHLKLEALTPHGSCGCAYDKPDDLCMHHSPQLMKAQQREQRLVEALKRIANGSMLKNTPKYLGKTSPKMLAEFAGELMEMANQALTLIQTTEEKR